MHKNKNKKLFKSKTQAVLYIGIFILLLMGFIYFGNINYQSGDTNQGVKKTLVYNRLDKNNIFEIIDSKRALEYIKEDNVLLLFGNKNNGYVEEYLNILNRVAQNLQIDKIYYYDITDDRANKNGNYGSIIEYLKNYTYKLDDGSKEIYGPSFLIKKEGNIIFFDTSYSIVKGDLSASEYFTVDNIRGLESTLTLALTTYQEGGLNG